MKTSRKSSSGRTSRPLMFVASSAWVALILVILVFRGGGTEPVEPHRKSAGLSPAQQAEVLANRGDYGEAWTLYHQALLATPEDVSLRYALGVTLSHLNQPQTTEETFQYVVRHGKPDSEEVKRARQWLLSAGVIAEPVRFPSVTVAMEARRDTAAVQGRTTWGEPDANRPGIKAYILLQGLDGAADRTRFSTRVTLGQLYRFEHLPPGSYRLIGRTQDHLLWDLTILAEDGKTVTQDLSQDNSTGATVVLSN